MAVDRHAQRFVAGFGAGQKTQHRFLVVAVGKAFAMHQAARFEFAVGQQESVGRDQGDARVIGPARQQRGQHARKGAFADRDAAAMATR